MGKIMNKKLYVATLLTLGFVNNVSAIEVTGKLTQENAFYAESGTTNGAAGPHKDTKPFKSETSARIYIDGETNLLNSTFHVELQGFNDSQNPVSSYTDSEDYTQRETLREAYIDSNIGDWAIRTGKQQTVWGTADGMKLLDAINPTDFSELVQNQMEDSRIPVWMMNAEKINDNGSQFQVILADPKSSYIPGLSSIEDNSTRTVTVTRGNGAYGAKTSALSKTTKSVDQGHPFIMKGVDAISGSSNGILNIIPEMGAVARTFSALGAAFTPSNGAGFHLENWGYATVEEFVNNTGGGANFGGACPDYVRRESVANLPAAGSAYCLQEIAFNTNKDSTNLLSGMTYKTGAGDYDSDNPDTVFEYMPDATFKTFAQFAGAKSKYVREFSDTDVSAGFRYKDTTKGGLNFSLNYLRAPDTNSHIDLEWQNENGHKLTPSLVEDSTGGGSGATGYKSVKLTDPGGNSDYGSRGHVAIDGTYRLDNPVTLVLKEKNAVVDNYGGSFDTTIETENFGPVVIRGEALYQKGVMTPIIDRAQMSVGNITEAFTAKKGDRFKYVIGTDITALTNMMVSFQFIQDRNLDYEDTTTTIANNYGRATNTVYDTDVTGARYTGDMASMSMQNQYQKAEKNKEFYSLYLSKPYGSSGQHRWNNIFIFEENGGKWNRLDTEYTLNDSTILTAEYNKYFGSEDTMFGQFKAASNVQVGLKYSF
jgi:hypothetical protein